MAKITSTSDLVRSSSLAQLGVDGNIWIETSTLDIYLDQFGAMSDEGVSLQTLYSYLKEEWRTDAELIKFAFPMDSITSEQFEFINGWDLAKGEGTGDADTTRLLIRDGGWALRSGGVSQEEYMNVTTLGAFNDPNSDLAYFLQSDGGTPEAINLAGPVNQAVQIYGDATHGDFDYRGFFRIYLREQGKIFASYDLTAEQNIPALTYQRYAMPLSNAIDLKVEATDNEIETDLPYTGMSITYHAAPVQRTIGAGSYDFSIIIDGNSGTAEEIYEFVQYQLRQETDIDAGAGEVIGRTADALLQFVGDTLNTLYTSEGGVFIDNFQPADTNRITFRDDTNTVREFPFVAAGRINFNDNLQNSGDAVFRMFFSSGFNSAAAIIVEDADENPIAGTISASEFYDFTFDYDGNTQGGRTPATDAAVTVVAIGTTAAQYVSATSTIGRSIQNVITLVAPLERNYAA